LLVIFGITIVLILLLTTAIACWRESALKDLIGFFSTVVAMLGTLLGGVVAFYFARRRPIVARSTPSTRYPGKRRQD
jgi:hypothetical protein